MLDLRHQAFSELDADEDCVHGEDRASSSGNVSSEASKLAHARRDDGICAGRKRCGEDGEGQVKAVFCAMFFHFGCPLCLLSTLAGIAWKLVRRLRSR